MGLDQAIAALALVKPAAKLIPGAGQYIEGAIDAVNQALNYVKDIKANKAANLELVDRAARCTVIVIQKTLEAMPKTQVGTRINSIEEINQLTEKLVYTARAQAERGLLSRIWYKDWDKEEIQSLSNRFDQVVKEFGIEANIIMVYDVEKVKHDVEKVQNLQIRAEQDTLLDKLQPVVAARHDYHGAPPGCIENTRVGVLNKIFKWALGQAATQTVFWLSGFAGTGKSAIMKSLSQMLANEGILGGCFFISRVQSGDRCNPHNIVRTIAFQLAEFHPVLREPICSVVRDQPTIANQDMAIQIPRLLTDVFTAVSSQIERPIVIMIDALDECEKIGDMEGGRLLEMLEHVISQHPTKLKLIVASRPTPTFQRKLEAICPQQLRLHDIDCKVVSVDIQLYLQKRFEKITHDRGLENEESWYTEQDMIDIVRSAGNLFIFAFTVVQWVESPDFMPGVRLLQILKRRPLQDHNSPYKPLDSVYQSILSAALGPNNENHNTIGQRIHRLLETLVVAFRPLSVPELAMLLESDEGTVRIDLGKLSAVLYVPEINSADPVFIHHASFIDHITNPARCDSSSVFHVAVWEAHGRMGAQCLSLHHRRNRCIFEHVSATSGLCNSQPSGYASEWWEGHFRQSSASPISPTSPSYILKAIEEVRQTAFRFAGNMDILTDLSTLLAIQSDRSPDGKFTEEKLSIDRQVLKLIRQPHPKHDQYLSNLADGLWYQYEQSRDQKHLDEAVSLYQQALELRPPGHAYRAVSLNNLANVLWSLYKHNNNEKDLDDAISYYRDSLKLRPPGHSYRDESLSNLANGLTSLYERSRSQECIDEAIMFHRQALELRPPGHPYRASSLNNLASGLKLLYERNINEKDINETISLYREALELRPKGHTYRAVSLNNLANALQTLYKHDNNQIYINEAVLYYQDALSLRLPDHPDRDVSMHNLANGLFSLYKHSGKQEHIDKAVALYRSALEIRPSGHPFHYESLIGLAGGLKSLYERHGNQEHIAEAIKLYRQVLKLCPPGHIYQIVSMNNLANALWLQYKKGGDANDIDEVISLFRQTLELCPLGHPCHHSCLNNLANGLLSLYKLSKDQKNIDEAILLHQQALGLHPPGHPKHQLSKKNLATSRKLLPEHSENEEDVDETNPQ